MTDPKLELELELKLVIRDKYDGNAELVTEDDRKRLVSGEPLAYIIGWVPFLSQKIFLESPLPLDSQELDRVLDKHPARALIPRPETEWWTQKLILSLQETKGDAPFSLLDLCAGSGAIGIAVAAAFPNARVSFGDIETDYSPLIQKNLQENAINTEQIGRIGIGDLFDPFAGEHFDVIATNPPYIPAKRELEESVINFEPSEALFSGEDGLACIERIIRDAQKHLKDQGEVWIECDIANIEKAKALAQRAEAKHAGFEAEIIMDQYDRPRVLKLTMLPQAI